MTEKVCITGGAGFIGSHLVEEFCDDFDVVVVDDLSTGRRENIEPFLDNIEYREEDIRNQDVMREILADVDWIFHEAAIPSVPRSMERPVETTDVNLMGSIRLMQAAVEAGVKRFIYASSSSVYGDQDELPKVETMEKQPESPYAQAKSNLEGWARIYAEKFDLHTVGLRYFNVFGPRQDPDSEYSAVIPKFISRLQEGKPGVIYGDGEQSRDFTFVKDVVRANRLAAASGVAGEVYNVSYNDQLTINNLHETLADLIGVSFEPDYDDPRPGDVRHSRGDVSKFKGDTGFRPEYSVEEGLRRTISSYTTKVETSK